MHHYYSYSLSRSRSSNHPYSNLRGDASKKSECVQMFPVNLGQSNQERANLRWTGPRSLMAQQTRSLNAGRLVGNSLIFSFFGRVLQGCREKQPSTEKRS